MAQQRKRTNGRTVALTSDRIIEAALRIADAEADLDRLTVRRLAAELEVGTMTLYGYFRSRDEILDGMADRAMGRMRLPAEPDAGPAEALRTVAYAFLAMMREHPSAAWLLASRVTGSPTALRGAMEAVLQRLVDAGIPGRIAVRCYGFLITYTIGFVGYQTPRPWGRLADPESIEQRRRRVHHYAGLPADEFPQVVKYADAIADLPSDGQFISGVEAYIVGMLREIDRKD
ncbi:TetR/AcrR family transcriptional regulator [Nocardia alni]|uniref:TetR/AcrR family transcriptional regulator n=1 Tax=Nocardia alni TaxID=2815723 RepID=UPI001C227697|nr:TetR/AcrR family transcriptional regulator [Nocardia alni]